MSYFVIEVRGSAAAAHVDALNQAHTAMVTDLAAAVDPHSTGTFGIDQVAGTFSSTVTGNQVGDHLAAVQSAYDKIKAAAAAVDPNVDAKFTYSDDDGKTTTHAMVEPVAEPPATV